MGAQRLPSIDLVVASVDRVEELGRMLGSFEEQTHQGFRVVVVDQNQDERLAPLLGQPRPFEVVRLRSQRGLSRARNAALGQLEADLVGFPDDDCVFPSDLLAVVAQRFAQDRTLDGLTGREVDQRGSSSPSWAREGAVLTRNNLWNRAISFTIFFRAALVRRVGAFDEALGLGSGEPWSSGEEIDYLVRAVDTGARIEYDPSVVVVHEGKARSVGTRDGASIGYILRKHAYPIGTVGRMLVRPLGGALLALARGDGARARFHLSTLRGRLIGYRS